MSLTSSAPDFDAVVQLLAELEGLGVQLWEDNGKLHFRAPKGVMSDDRRAALRDLKPQTLDYLRREPRISVVPHPEARFEPFPLTQVQEAYLLGRGSAFPYGGIGCHAYGEIILREVEPARLQRAWDALVKRHDMLRAVIEADGWQQVLRDAPPFQIAVADLRAAAPAEVQTRIEASRGELDHRTYAPGQWPLFDLRLTLAHDRAVLHLSIDFLIADYVSISLLLRELRQLYDEPDRELPPLRITFRDYQLAERPLRAGSRYERDRRYWWRRIDDLPTAPELPILDWNPGARRPRFHRLGMRLPRDRWRRLHECATARGLTGSAAIVAAYAEVIARWAARPRFTLNVTLLQRFPLHADVDKIVGDFTSVTLLAVDRVAALSVGEHAKALQAQLWEDLDHRVCSGIDVMREIVRRRGREAGLMPIIFTSAIGLSGQGSEPSMQFNQLAYGISQTPQAWIDCQAMEQDGALQITWDVREGVFPDGVIEAMFVCFRALVDDLAASDLTWDATSPIALPGAQARRRATEDPTTAAPGVLHQAFVEQALKTPERQAVISAQKMLSYSELYSRASAVANRLQNCPGAQGGIVGILMETGPDQVVSAQATLLSGAAYLPIDTRLPAKRRDRMLADACAGVVLTNSGISADALPRATECLDVGDPAISAAGESPVETRAAPDNLAYVIYTSGSTGVPKGVMIAHRAAANTIEDINRRFKVNEHDRILGVSSLAFDLSVYDIFGPLAAGACLVLPDHRCHNDPSHWAQLMRDHHVTIWNSVPAKMQLLLDHLDTEGSEAALPLRLVLLSGDTITPALAARVRRRWPHAEVVSLGGATEASIWSIIYPIADVGPDRRRIPYGKALRNQTFYVLDGALRQRPDWCIGELYIGGEGLAVGYLGDEALTAERFIRHPQSGERLYRTGDIGRYLPDGNIEFLGRNDSQVKLRGHRIELAEIETVLQSHAAVDMAAAVLHEEAGTRRLAAFVVPRRRASAEGPVSRIVEALAAAAQSSTAALRAGVDCDRVARFAKQLDRTALLAMLHALRSQNVFADLDTGSSLADILALAQVAPRHHRLVRRWLNALQQHGLVQHDHRSGQYRGALAVDGAAVEEAWRRAEELQPDGDHRTELMDYFRLASRRLPELLRGDLDPVQLLFPQGRVEIHEVAYNDNFLSRYLNRLVTEAICEIGRGQLEGSIDVLEIGAGVGGTSVELIPALAKFSSSYLFTDVSQFFLNNAAERFRDYPWVRYGLFDINQDYQAQGLSANSFDVVLCANVLHYSIDANAVVARIRELLRPGGWLVFIELVRDNYQVLTSMEFLFDETVTEFADVRKGRDATFIGRQEWHDILLATGAEAVFCLPRGDDVLSEVGFHVFCAQFKAEYHRVTASELDAHLREFLPPYMVPGRIEVLERLPLTDNGKIDRRTLNDRLGRQAETPRATAGQRPATELEQQIAAIWASILKLPEVGRDQDFFALGGDSLTAAQVVARMREEIPDAGGLLFDALLRLMLDGPDVAHVATVVEQHRAQKGSAAGKQMAAAPLVELLGPAEAARSVLLHDSGGTLACYDHLLAAASSVPQARGIAGLQLADIDTYLKLPPEVLVQRVASDYAQAMGDLRGRNVHLVGRDIGGVLALEVARCLTETGLRVSVSLIGSLPLRFLIEDTLLTEYLTVRQAGVDPMRLGFPGEAALARGIDEVLRETPGRVPEGSLMRLDGDPELQGVAWCFRRLGRRAREERVAAFSRDLMAAGGRPGTLDRVGSMADVVLQSVTAVAMHDISPYAGGLTLLRPSQSTPLWPALDDAAISFWRQRCLGNFEVVDVAGDHLTCLQPPHAAGLVEVLARNGGSKPLDA
jgi:pyochelin synthetase